MEHFLQHEGTLNRGVGVNPGCATTKAPLRVSPSCDSGFVEPQRDPAPGDQRLIVVAPIPDTVMERIVSLFHAAS